MRYAIPCLLFLANDECISLLGLIIILAVFLVDIFKAREGQTWNS